VNAELIQLSVAAVSGGAIQWAAKPLWTWFTGRRQDELSREQHINLLRRALDKASIRQNATISICDLLLLALDLVDQLPPSASRAKEQARQKLADVVATLSRLSGGTGDF
jgi:hypothetical protein